MYDGRAGFSDRTRIRCELYAAANGVTFVQGARKCGVSQKALCSGDIAESVDDYVLEDFLQRAFGVAEYGHTDRDRLHVIARHVTTADTWKELGKEVPSEFRNARLLRYPTQSNTAIERWSEHDILRRGSQYAIRHAPGPMEALKSGYRGSVFNYHVHGDKSDQEIAQELLRVDRLVQGLIERKSVYAARMLERLLHQNTIESLKVKAAQLDATTTRETKTDIDRAYFYTTLFAVAKGISFRDAWKVLKYDLGDLVKRDFSADTDPIIVSHAVHLEKNRVLWENNYSRPPSAELYVRRTVIAEGKSLEQAEEQLKQASWNKERLIHAGSADVRRAPVLDAEGIEYLFVSARSREEAQELSVSPIAIVLPLTPEDFLGDKIAKLDGFVARFVQDPTPDRLDFLRLWYELVKRSFESKRESGTTKGDDDDEPWRQGEASSK